MDQEKEEDDERTLTLETSGARSLEVPPARTTTWKSMAMLGRGDCSRAGVRAFKERGGLSMK